MTVQVSVCGPAQCGDEVRMLAYELGRRLADRGAVVICGGYGGVMAAVAAGARSRDGLVVGVLSGADREGGGPDLSVVIPTGIGQARNSVLVNSGDAVIVVGGSWGTLTELAMAARRAKVPVIQLGKGWTVLDADGKPLPGLQRAQTAEEAVRLTGLWDRPAR